MDQHVKVLAVLYIVMGALGVLGALACLAIFGGLAGIVQVAGHANDNPEALVAAPILGIIAVLLTGVVFVMSLPGIVAGYGLLKFRSWARILTIILSGLNLFNVPVGTALGIYGLWVLLSKEAEPLFREPGASRSTGQLPSAG